VLKKLVLEHVCQKILVLKDISVKNVLKKLVLKDISVKNNRVKNIGVKNGRKRRFCTRSFI